jgi:hypothetical protein
MPQAHDLSLEGRVAAVAADRGHHFSKPTNGRIILVEGHGVESDAHAGTFVRHRYLARRRPRLPNLRQVHLIPSELFATLLKAGFEVGAGDLGENITTAGLDLERMPLGTLIELGPMAMIELTGLRTPFPGGLETAGALVGGNGPSIQMWGAGRGSGRRTGCGWRCRAGSAPVLLISCLAGSVERPVRKSAARYPTAA